MAIRPTTVLSGLCARRLQLLSGSRPSRRSASRTLCTLLPLLAIVCLAAGMSADGNAQTLGEAPYVSFTGAATDFPLVANRQGATLLVSTADWPGVVRAVGDLRDDVNRVSGITPPVANELSQSGAADAVIVGTIGKSPWIDELVQRKKLDVHDIQGHWEMEVTTLVDRPFPGIRRALVIAGADKRGTIYGIYDLSEQIGVSPWYWWADVRIPHHDALFVQPGRHLQPEPAVKYRGIFFNDEAPALSGWTTEKFGGMNSKFYTHVFELLLRLKANFLWPAMWNNAFAADDPDNPRLADEYGIVMSTSHEEPMMRAEKEWTRNPANGPWDYATNSKRIDEYWRAGMERDKNYEEVVTLGMRGLNDTPMSDSTAMAQLEKVVGDQRQILRETVNPDITKVPQVWALYKEVQGYYEKGLRVPDDVTLLWSDDNWGNLRRLPTPAERKRPGGAGIYYHFDYVGGPRSYKWLNTYSITKVREQMHLALAYGANRIWVVNVGDLKPMEFPIEFFLDYARTPQRWSQDDLHQFTVDWATREFGPEHAEDIARCMEEYTLLNSLRKPEMMEPTTFSLNDFDEADRVEATWTHLIQRVDALAAELPADEQASFFELVGYPAKASGNVVLMDIAAGRNAQDARSAKPQTNPEMQDVERRFALDQQYTDDYNHKLLNGKWDHMMDQTHIGYFAWFDPPANAMPPVTALQPDGVRLPVRAFHRPAPKQASGPPPPAGFKGSVEQDGYVAVEAANTSGRTGAAPDLHWAALPGFYFGVPDAPAAEGIKPLAAMAVLPSDGASQEASNAGLSYRVYLYDTGAYLLHLRVAPTLNFVPGRGLRVAYSLDDGPREVVDLLAHDSPQDWALEVSDGARKVDEPLTVGTPGMHTLHIWAVDPAVVLERLVLAHGPLKPSYLGPPESTPGGAAGPNTASAATAR